jgi:hypothetical protein
MKSYRYSIPPLKIIPGVPRIFWFNIDKDNYNEIKGFYNSVKDNYKCHSILYKNINANEVGVISDLLLKYSILVIVSTINFNDPITNDRLLVKDNCTDLSELNLAIKIGKYKKTYNVPIDFCNKLFSIPRILLVSPGGCACSSILKFISNTGLTSNVNSNIDFLKHILPTSSIIKIYNPSHIIYIYGDLVKLIRSFFRRGMSFIREVHCPKLHINDNYILTQDTYNINFQKYSFNSFKEYIDTVIQTKTEPIGIIKHYEAWKKVPGVFFIHYEDFPKSDKVDEFLGLPNGTCSQFELKERTSIKQPEETDEYLEIIKSLEPW